MRRKGKRLKALREHLEWLDGRLPSVALDEDYTRDFSKAPIAKWLAKRNNRSVKRIQLRRKLALWGKR